MIFCLIAQLTFSQAVVMDAISGIDLSAPESPSLVMRELSTYAALPFLASFTTPSAPPQQTTAVPKPKPQKRITYIAVFKKVMPLLVELFLQFKSKLEIYVDGTVESVLSVSCHSFGDAGSVCQPAKGIFDPDEDEIRLSACLGIR
jgi:hypothetical protein